MFGNFPSEYDYDTSGVRIRFDVDGNPTTVSYSSDEIAQIEAARDPALFYSLEQGFRQKYKEKHPSP